MLSHHIIHPLSSVGISQVVLKVLRIYFDLMGGNAGPRQQAKPYQIILNIPSSEGKIKEKIMIARRYVISSALAWPIPESLYILLQTTS